MAEKVVIGNAELWHGDCREVLPLLPAHGLLCTDPPYGIGAGEMSLGKWRTSRMEKKDWDTDTPPQCVDGADATLQRGAFCDISPRAD